MAVKKGSDDGLSFEEGNKVERDKSSDLMYKELIEDLRRDIEELKSKSSAASENEGWDEEYDAKEDYLDTPAVFFAFSCWYGVYGDKRYGREVTPPRNQPIIFEKLYRYSKKTGGRTAEMVSVSQATIRSASMADWLRNHSLFGIKFFEDMGKAQNVNVTLAEKMSEMNNVVNRLNDHAVIERCTREGITVATGDLMELRKVLTRKLAEQALKNEKNQRELKLRGGERDKDGRVVEDRKVDVDNDLQTTSVY
jgi:hypothetical protein